LAKERWESSKETSDMPYCRNCGHEVQGTTKFCPECGQDQAVVVPQDQRIPTKDIQVPPPPSDKQGAGTIAWTGQDTRGASKSGFGLGGAPRRLVYVAVGVIIVLILLILAILSISSLVGERTPDDVVEDFREAGLDVGESYPLDEEPNTQSSILPKTYQEATRFVIPSLGKDSDGQDRGGASFPLSLRRTSL
jgi:zinc-ribbon domain